MTPGRPSGRLFAIAVAALSPTSAFPQTDEIQVYNAEIAPPGVFNLTVHNNYTPDGHKQPDFPGAIASNHALNGVPELAYGVTDWLEAGLYFPLYSVAGNGQGQINGFKVRALFVDPHAAEKTFFYGVNFEFSFNSHHWDPHTYTSEIRPIVGWRLGRVDVIFNPILDNSWEGVSHLDFAPETRIAYNVSKTWAVAAEEYDDLGPLGGFYGHQQTHQLFGVVDFNSRPINVEFGLGFGLNAATDRLTLKLILSRDL
jgi:hypothetical protein